MVKAILVYQKDGENEPRIEKFDDVDKCEGKVILLNKLNKGLKEEVFKGIMWNIYEVAELDKM